MADTEQIITPDFFTGPPVEIENVADDGQWWQIIADIVEDLLEQQVPGSVVLLLVFVIYLPKIFSTLRLWITRGSRS